MPALLEHFVRMHNAELKRSFKGVDGATMKILMSASWKGNVRELDNVIEHAMILAEGDWITSADLPRTMKADATIPVATSDDLREALRSYEKAHIESVLAKADQDKKATAELLGVSLSSLYRKIEELGIGAASQDASS